MKVLAAKSLSDAQGGTLLAGWIKILPIFLIVVPGMISRVLYPNTVGCVDPDVCEVQTLSKLSENDFNVSFISRHFVTTVCPAPTLPTPLWSWGYCQRV